MPGGDRGFHPGDRVEVIAELEHVDRQLVVEPVESRRELHGRLVDEGADVDVAGRRVLLHEVDDRLGEALPGEGEAGAEELGGVEEPRRVLRQAEDVDRLTILVEVTADAGECAGAILHGVGADADLGFGEVNDVALEVGVFQHRARTCHESLSLGRGQREIGHGCVVSHPVSRA
jgi:hypothetical protein